MRITKNAAYYEAKKVSIEENAGDEDLWVTAVSCSSSESVRAASPHEEATLSDFFRSRSAAALMAVSFSAAAMSVSGNEYFGHAVVYHVLVESEKQMIRAPPSDVG